MPEKDTEKGSRTSMEKRSNKELLDKVRGYPKKLTKATSPVRAKAREKLSDFEDVVTSDPEDDIFGPALATGSSLVKDMFFSEPEDGEMPMMGGIAGTVGKKGKKALDLLKKENTSLGNKKVLKEGKEAIEAMVTPKHMQTSSPAQKLATREANDPKTVYSKMLYKLKNSKTPELREIVRKQVSGDTPVDRLSNKELQELFIKTETRDPTARDFLSKLKTKYEDIDAKVKAQPSQKDIYPHLNKKR